MDAPKDESRAAPVPLAPNPTLRRVLGLLPLVIVIVWLQGLSWFRGYDVSPVAYLVLAAMLFAGGLFLARLRQTTGRRHRPEPRPFRMASIAASILGVLALVLGGAVEIALQLDQPVQRAPLWLRIGWHVACGYAGAWCRFASQFLPR